jgi:maltose alpha-D-glucosyltransferase/alpha-amylase
MSRSSRILTPSSEWYRDAVIYELHVRAFVDSDDDGIGDFDGLTSRLDYLVDLGVTALWLLPFYPSPLRDDGYDIADYTSIHPSYGDMASFRRLLREAKERGLRIITELVLNHTSDQHAWFQRARRAAPGSKWRDFYVWSDDPTKYSQARIIFQDFEQSNWTWDPLAEAYYWHRFYSHQPDLNYDNPAVHDAMLSLVDYWLAMGIDGVRLDAVPYLYEREGTNCENLPETHEFLKKVRAHVDERFDDRMLLAEANQWPEDAAAYFGDGDECHMNFHFPVMPRLFMALRQENRNPIVDILDQTPALPDGCQWATFLRNHDELTLEMVTDEERDYMYRAYAQDAEMRINLGIRRRLAPLLGGDRRKIELLNSLLFALPGTPVLYYGDEIGMGDNVYLGDRDAVRTPMQWTPDRNAGFSTANPHALYLPPITDSLYHYERVNVEYQQQDPTSLYSWMRQLIAVRGRHPELGRGDIRFFDPDNPKVIAFLRTLEGRPPLLIVANLSRLAQSVELDLSEHLGAIPREVFGHSEFAPVGELPYYLTIAPYGTYWFTLERREDALTDADRAPDGPERLEVSWNEALRGRTPPLKQPIVNWIRHRRWFGGKQKTITGSQVKLIESLEGSRRHDVVLVLIEIAYTDGDPDLYCVPVAVVSGNRAADVARFQPEAVVAELPSGDLVIDAMVDDASALALSRAMVRRNHSSRKVVAEGSPELRKRLVPDRPTRLLGVEQSNSSYLVGDDLLFKIIRRIDHGANPELEIGRHLREVGYAHAAQLLGSLSRQRTKTIADTLVMAYRFESNEGDAWQHALHNVGLFYDNVLIGHHEDALDIPTELIPDGQGDGDDPGLVGGFIDDIALLGRRTAELHAALAADDPSSMDGFEPERFSKLSQRSLYQGFRASLRTTLSQLRKARKGFAPDVAEIAEAVLDQSDQLQRPLGVLRERVLDAERIRIHGDFHLGQVLVTAHDFVFIDFEGEPARPIGERRIKKTPLADIAGMLRSFDYVARVGLHERIERGLLSPDAAGSALTWSWWWTDRIGETYLQAYLAHQTDFLPADSTDVSALLDVYLLDKALYEVRYELGSRPDWVGIPLQALYSMIEGGSLVPRIVESPD